MSEYQYYEFQAIDKPLDENALEVMHNLSSRAHITPTSFSNEYNFGSFKGDPLKLMELYYDAFVYVTNWGTRELMFKVPKNTVDWDFVKQYCISEYSTAYPKGDSLILEFTSNTEEYEWEQGEGWLSSLVSLRADIMRGDYRCLYLGWLYGVQNRKFDDDDTELPVPNNLQNLNRALNSFINFMRIDSDFVAVAAEKSESASEAISEKALGSWIDALSNVEKNNIIKQLILSSNPHLGADLLRRFTKETDQDVKERRCKLRTVGELLLKSELYYEKRQKELAEKKAAEKAAREKAATIAREKYLNGISGREEILWNEVEGLINAKKARFYEKAIQTLIDLRDLGKKNNDSHTFKVKLRDIREKHQRKTTLISAMNRAGLK